MLPILWIETQAVTFGQQSTWKDAKCCSTCDTFLFKWLLWFSSNDTLLSFDFHLDLDLELRLSKILLSWIVVYFADNSTKQSWLLLSEKEIWNTLEMRNFEHNMLATKPFFLKWRGPQLILPTNQYICLGFLR